MGTDYCCIVLVALYDSSQVMIFYSAAQRKGAIGEESGREGSANH